MTKTLLINPYLTVAGDDPAQPSIMLSLPYLAAYLRKNGFPVKLLDVAGEGCENVIGVGAKKRYGLSDTDILDAIKTEAPDVVGITAPSTSHITDVQDMARFVKSVCPKALVVVGGAHASSNFKEVLNDNNVDLVIIGEGEETLLDLVRRVDGGASLEAIPGTAFRKDGAVHLAAPRPYIENLDKLPFPARDLLPIEALLQRSGEGVNYAMRKRFVTMITSRGCPGSCIYCGVKSVWGHRWRGRSAANVVDEVEELMLKYGAGEIHFLDDSMSVSKTRLMEICDEIIRRKLDIKWTTPNGIAVWFMDKALLRKMKQAGCYRLTFGLESGNKETLKFMGKHYDYGQAREMIRYAGEIGIWTIGTFIIGFPYEKRESIEDTISFAIKSDLNFAVFYIANPLPGTKMYEYFDKEGLLPKDNKSIVRGVGSKYFSHEELVKIQSEAFTRFMRTRVSRPGLFLNKVRGFEDFKYLLKLGGQFSKMLMNSRKIEKEGTAVLWKNSGPKKR